MAKPVRPDTWGRTGGADGIAVGGLKAGVSLVLKPAGGDDFIRVTKIAQGPITVIGGHGQDTLRTRPCLRMR